MPDYRIVVQIDPTQAKAGAGQVDDSLAKLQKRADDLKKNIDRAMDFAGGGTKQGLVDMASAATDAASATSKLANDTQKLSTVNKAAAAVDTQRVSALRDMAEVIKQTSAAEVAAYKATQNQTVAMKGAAAAAAEVASTSAAAGVALASHAKQGAASAVANDNLTKSGRQTGEMFRNLSFQLNDVVTGLASGQRPMQILAQQGGQVFQALQMGPGGVGGALRSIGALLTPTRIAFGLLAGAMLTVAMAAQKESAATADLEAATYGLGRGVGLTAAQLDQLAQKSADGGKVSVNTARQMEEQYIHLGVTAPAILQGLIEHTKDYAKATGTEAKDAVTALGVAFADPKSGAASLDKAIGGLDGSTKKLIDDLVAQGKVTEAQTILLKLLEDRTNSASGAVDGLSAAMDKAGKLSANFMHNVGQFFAGRSEEEVAQDYAGFGRSPVLDQADQARSAAAAAAAQDKLNKLTLAGSAAYADMVPHMQQINKLNNDKAAMNGLLTAGSAALAKAGITEAQAKDAIAQADKQIADLEKSPEQKKAESRAEAAARAAANHAAELARELAAMRATTAANIDLSRSYGVSNAAVTEAQARIEAEGKAIKNKGDIDAFVSAQQQLNAAKSAADAAGQVASMEARNAALISLNDQVAAGTINQKQANDTAGVEMALYPLRIALAGATGAAYIELKRNIDALRTAMEDANKEQERQQVLEQTSAANDNLAQLDKERLLIGATNIERAVAIAQLQAQQDLQRNAPSMVGTAEGDAYVKSRVAAADAQERLNELQFNFNNQLAYEADMWGSISQAAADVSTDLGKSFGTIGTALGALNKTLADHAKRLADINKARSDYVRAGGNDAKRLQDYSNQQTQAEIKNYGDQLDAASSFFSTKSTMYKELQAAEQAFRLVEFALSVQSMFQKTAETTAEIANQGAQTTAVVAGSAARATAKGAEGVAGIFAALGPFAFPVAAAAIAFMVAAGVGGLGHGGSSVNTDAEDRQKAQGTGSVLGASDDKSSSIENSLKLVASNTNSALEFSSKQLRALQDIDLNIGALTAQLARDLGVGGSLSTSQYNLGTTKGADYALAGPGASLLGPLIEKIPVIGGIIKSLFGTKTTTTLVDQGLQFGSQTLGDISANGLDASVYNEIQTQKKKKAFGITYSNKTNTSTDYSDLDSSTKDDLTRIITSMEQSVVQAAGQIGLTGAQSVLDAFAVNLDTVSLKGLQGQDLTDAINAVFSKLGDDMATAAAPALLAVQKVGEGMFETLQRVAKDSTELDLSLAQIGKTFGATGISSIVLRERLIDLAGGLDQFQSQADDFAKTYLSKDEQMLPVIKSVYTTLGELGYGSIKTKDQFKQLVLGLDLTTTTGQDTYTALMAIAPAFANVADYMDSLTTSSEDVSKAQDTLQNAYETAVGVITDLRDQWQGFVDDLKKFMQDLTTGSDALLSPEDRYNKTKALFQSTSAKALTGDKDAIAALQSVSQDFLDASKDYFASSTPYFDDLDAVKSVVTQVTNLAQGQVDAANDQLNALNNMVSGLVTVNTSVLTVKDAVDAVSIAIGGLATATANQTTAINNATNAATSATSAGSGASTPANSTDKASAYLAANGDVAQSAANGWLSTINPGDLNGDGVVDSLDRAIWHYTNYGQTEGRKFAKGGAFSNGIVNSPSFFNIGEMGEAGTEAIMPLVKTAGGRLGVSAAGAGGGGLDDEDKALLREQNELLQALILQNAEMSKASQAVLGELVEETGNVKKAVRDAA